ncbi:MAG: hypothetical protein ACTSRZ_18695 [Promethearchaeota archaeon]
MEKRIGDYVVQFELDDKLQSNFISKLFLGRKNSNFMVKILDIEDNIGLILGNLKAGKEKKTFFNFRLINKNITDDNDSHNLESSIKFKAKNEYFKFILRINPSFQGYNLDNESNDKHNISEIKILLFDINQFTKDEDGEINPILSDIPNEIIIDLLKLKFEDEFAKITQNL